LSVRRVLGIGRIIGAGAVADISIVIRSQCSLHGHSDCMRLLKYL